ncbi:hypothetical protein H5410_030746 [Solanum commersonii]|uniref:Uncharacterized protein n=1 Tax=Solanum commersonii TaxID=4109 RepID=A0A9J5YIB3_SOLCO|nr:hypothetical protein H5410_030746 [Solanum commersonii]
MFAITADNVIDLLKEVTDNTLREKIIQLVVSKTSSSTSIPSDKKVKDEFNYSAPYSLYEVHNRLSSKQIMEEIKFLKQNYIIYDHCLTQIESANSKRKNKVDDSTADENILANTLNIDPKQNMFLGMMQILYLPIILGTPFINAIYPFTNINAKRFSATYKNQDISYTFITEPISKDINALIEMKQKHRKRHLYSRKGKIIPKFIKSSYGSSSSSTPIIQKGGMSLYNLNSRAQEKASSSIHLKYIPESDPLYAKLQEFITQKQDDSFASITKEEVDDIKTYEKVKKKEIIFLLENSDIQRRKEPWKIFQRYLVNGLYFPGESYKTQKYYETLLISTGV